MSAIGRSVVLCLALTSAVWAVPVGALTYEFPEPDPTTVRRALEDSAVRIFDGEKSASQQVGSGFLIDARARLVLSAAHVVRGIEERVFVSFSGETTRYKASIVRQRDDAAAAAPPSPAPDIVLLQLDANAPIRNNELELHLAPINENQEHRVTGFGRDSPKPVPAPVGQPARQNDCLYTLRGTIVHGDSGSAVLASTGLADGVATSGREAGGEAGSYAQLVMVPISCVQDYLTSAIPGDDDADIVGAMHTKDQNALRAFEPKWGGRNRFSNVRIAKALAWWASRRDRSQPLSDEDYERLSWIMSMVGDRKVGTREVSRYANALPLARQFAQADVFQTLGDQLRAKGSLAQAVANYTLANQLYLTYAHWLQTNKTSPWDIQAAENLGVAKSYKAAADSLTKAAELSRDQSLFSQATTFAAAAIFHSPNGPFKAASWAALGAAASGGGDYDKAAVAFRNAVDLQGSAPWVKSGLLFAKSRLADKPQSTLDRNYLGSQAEFASRKASSAFAGGGS